MGYTHYWEFKKPCPSLKDVAKDFREAVKIMEKMGLQLANGDGYGKPVITSEKIVFNGMRNCGHKKQDIVIPWPSDNPKVGFNGGEVGKWFAGSVIETRSCDGSCDYETFYVRKGDTGFNFCKTAYRPYDFAVCVALIIMKHYFKDAIRVSSDGEMVHWQDTIDFVKHYFGYGHDFKLEE